MKTRFTLPFIIPVTIAIVFCRLSVAGQSAIATFSSSYVATGSVSSYSQFPASASGSFGGCSATPYTYTFANGSSNQLKLTGFTANGKSYLVAAGASGVVKLRRVDNSNVAGNRSVVFLESTSTPTSNCPPSGTLDFKPPYNDVMESFLNNNVINQGTDNIFTNAGNGDGNNNNIERVDVIFSSGLTTASITNAGFAILDRGNNNSHDPFRIAAITSLDGSGNPASFGSLKICTGGNGSNNGSWGHPSTANGNKQLAIYVLRKDPADSYLKASAAINQEIGGVFYSFSDLNIVANQTIYGYALLGPDGLVNPTSAQLLNTNDATIYPTNTTEANGGGLDLVTVNTVFTSGAGVLLPVQIEYFNGEGQYGSALLQWKLSGIADGKSIDLERSEDASHFSSIYTSGINSGPLTMLYEDKRAAGVYYYRLKITNPASGNIQNSTVLALSVAGDDTFQVYPTIAMRYQKLRVEGLPNGYYTAIFCNLYGIETKVNVYVQNNGGWVDQSPGGLAPGIYWLKLYNNSRPLFKGAKILIK